MISTLKLKDASSLDGEGDGTPLQYSCLENPMLDETQVGIKTSGRNINNLRYADTTLISESEEELKAS